MKSVENKTGCLTILWPESPLDFVRLLFARGRWGFCSQGKIRKVVYQWIR